MKKFKVNYSGFAYVEAEDENEAEDRYIDDESIFDEMQIDSICEVDEFRVRV